MVTWLLGYSVTQLLDYLVTRLLSYLVTWLLSYNFYCFHLPLYPPLPRILSATSPCRREYLHFASYTEQEVLGDGLQEGVLSTLLEAEEPLLLHLDGRLPESLALPLSQLADSREFMNGRGKKQVPVNGVRFLLETDNLANISESFLARSVVVDLTSLEPLVASLVLEHSLAREEDQDVRSLLREAVSLLLGCVGQQPAAPLDSYLQRSHQVKVQEMMEIFQSISTKTSSSGERMNFLVYSFFWAFTSCLPEQGQQEVAAKVRECLELHKEKVFSHVTIQEVPLALVVPQQGPLSQESASWTQWSVQETLVKLAVTLLRAHVPVLILGERLGQQVYEEVQASVRASLATTKVHSCDLHALSTASSVVVDLGKQLQRRGNTSLVPRESREIVLAIGDLATPAGSDCDSAVALVKDLLEPRKLYLEGHGFEVQDVTLLCKLSPKGAVFRERRSLSRFVCLYARDNFEESVAGFQTRLVSQHPGLGEQVGKVAEAAKKLLGTSHKSYSSLSMLLTSDIIVSLLAGLATATFLSGERLVGEFCRRLHQALVSPAIDLGQRRVVQQWIQASLASAGLTFSLEYDTEVSEDYSCAGSNPFHSPTRTAFLLTST